MKGTHTGLMSAEDGVVVVNDTTAYNSQRFGGIYIAEDTVIANLEVNGVVANVISDYVTTPATAIKGGLFITSKGDDVFSSITLTSGSVALILV